MRNESNKKRPRDLIMLGYFMLFLACFFLFFLTRKEARLAIFGLTADGTVISQEYGGRRTAYYKVEFKDKNGRAITFKTGNSFRAEYSIEQQVPVRYLQSNPEIAQIDSLRSLWLPLGFGSILSLILIAGGIRIVRGPKISKPYINKFL